MLTGMLDPVVAFRAVGAVLVVGFGGLALAPTVLPALLPASWEPDEASDRVPGRFGVDLGVRVRVVGGTGPPTAFAVGLLPWFGAVFLSTSLVERLSPREVRAVVAHEAGHVRRGHTLGRVGLPSLYVLAWVTAATTLGAPGFWLGLVGSAPVALLSFRFSRWTEFDADAYAVDRGHGSSLHRALRALADDGHLLDGGGVLSRHPALEARLDRIEARSGAEASDIPDALDGSDTGLSDSEGGRTAR